MGRKTFASIGRPLPGRTTIVLSRTVGALPGATVIPALDELPAAAGSASEIWICGGAELYALTLPRWREVWLTRVKREVDGDAFFPAFEHLFPAPAVVRDTPEFSILHFRRPEA
jgi:dihydrofolate reductase